MQDFLLNLFTAVLTAAVPVVSAYMIKMIRQTADNAKADTDNIKVQGYIVEISDAIAQAVSCTSQTYVDALKEKGEFTLEAQKEALQKSIETAKAILSPAALEFIDRVYGDFVEYVTPKIEAEVRKQKLETPVAIALPAITDTTEVAASTAAATAATIAQMNAEAVKVAMDKEGENLDDNYTTGSRKSRHGSSGDCFYCDLG